ncbi:cation:proton antiporter domain-containing protein [Profundibacterium mesophilum]|uniref:Glutathione-regulated potassium-efflux system protein KefC n=1 Tax=Profundibacterium mesophilum KAUST100406-0324 TaxID=1037889 RepID=A0A921TCJ6_9RHOB|nr:cation:proton antiporter [Profundibacterium mesophilum]KAF0674967.1 Glutathione-regulated potassium-efflux system protein KefC [Profundibacterium mesophilum KAUST100406-0324]
MESFLFQATVYLVAAVVAVPLASRLGLGSVLGYLMAGIVIGPVLGLVGTETESLQHFAEFGVVMMLFIIGLELEPKSLWKMRHKLLGLGGAQVVVTMGLIAGGSYALGQPVTVALAIGMIFALSSTAIVLQTLSEKGLMQTGGGRSSFSVLLTQDIAVIPMLALLPLLAVPGLHADFSDEPDEHGGVGSEAVIDTVAEDHAEAAMSLVEGLPGWGVTLMTLGAVAGIILMGVFATRPVFRFVHRAKLRELYTALALLIVIGIAFVMTLVGLSPALGTFLAGVVLANSEFRHELESDIEPFKGLLLGLFFITVGAGIAFGIFFEAPGTILGLTLAVMLIKGLVLYLLSLIFKMKGRDRWLFTLGLAQAGEFGFVLVSFSLQTNVLPPELGETLLLIVALSMLLTPLFFIAYEQISKRLTDTAEEDRPADTIDEQNPIIIAGIGRFGQVVNRMLQLAGLRTTVLDHDLDTIQLMRKFGFKSFFGDPSRPELLHAAGLQTARVLVVAMDDDEAATALVEYARRVRPDLHIVARARDRIHVYELYRAGADDIVRELFDSSLRAGRYVLENMGLSEYEASEMEKAFFKIDRGALRDLAQLWRPGVPVVQNEEYIARAKALNEELETALVNRYDTRRTRVEDDDED